MGGGRGQTKEVVLSPPGQPGEGEDGDRGGGGERKARRRQGALTGRPRLPPPCRVQSAEVQQETGNTDQEAMSSSKGPMVILLLAKPSLPAKSET